MEMRNCPRCKRIFSYINSPICSDCEKEEEKIFESVREYIKVNPDSSLSIVSEETGVSPKKILKYVKEGKLEISKGMGLHGENKCEQCGKPITKGKYCDTCVIKINQQVEDMFTVKKNVVKMHIADRLDKK